ncbi:hypothetical protein Salat_1591200 [Sesamum alatum]|uniref:Uncharacterized protein n=1 Tax=Sesamum alatum TaxID=300844 RepID=A0AAE2CJ16_9LAMI|nr:hypothetical protein Salat_1591200 [Sesamum alatum]
MTAFTHHSAEFPPLGTQPPVNSPVPEPTQPSHSSRQGTDAPTPKTFAEAVSSIPRGPVPSGSAYDLRKSFLANMRPAILGEKSFVDEEGEFIEDVSSSDATVNLSHESEGELGVNSTRRSHYSDGECHNSGADNAMVSESNQHAVVPFVPYQECIKISDPVCPLNLNPMDTHTGDQFFQDLTSPIMPSKNCATQLKDEVDSALLSPDQKMNALHKRSKSCGSKAPLFNMSKPAKVLKKVAFLSKDMPTKSASPPSSSS